MIGYISTIDKAKRYGHIKEKGTNTTYYFGFNSIIDKSAQLKVSQYVEFELHQKNEKEYVAVRIKKLNSHGRESDFLDAKVNWFSLEKRYGFVSCKTSCDAFLHIDRLHKIGVSSVKPGQEVKVKIAESKYKGRKEVTEILVKNNGPSCKQEQHFSRPPNHSSRLPPPMSNCTANDLTAIPVSLSQKCKSNDARYCNSTNGFPTNITNTLQFNQPHSRMENSSVTSRLTGHSGYPLFPNAYPHQGQMRQSEMTLNSSFPSTSRNNIRPSHAPNKFSPKPKQLITNPEYAKVKQQINQKEGFLRTLKVSKLPDAGQRLRDQITVLQEKLQTLSMYDCNNNSDQQGPTYSDKKPSVNHISNNTKEAFNPTQPCTSNNSLFNQTSRVIPSNEGYFGGRMTAKRIEVVNKVTIEAIEKLHESLSTCPPPIAEIPDPEGLQVTLMTHQRQALAWLVWREKQDISGGILADDMGLGKTLTMISLVLVQNTQTERSDHSSEDGDSTEKDDEEEEDDNDEKEEKASSGNNEQQNDDVEKRSESETNTAQSDLISSESTLIVTPAALVYQWENELRNRCRKGIFSIQLYHGSEREKEPEKLSEFDIVITTYDIVRRSFSVQGTNKKSASKPGSPTSEKEDALFRIKWRRVILDEAHHIRNTKTQKSAAICALQATSRWAISGTPIQNDENDMYAMLKFLHCHPFDEQKLWKSQVGNKTTVGRERLKTLVSSMVLRREKNQKGTDGKPIVDLPKRNFTSHTLKLNEVERKVKEGFLLMYSVYKKLHEESRSAFNNYEAMKKNKNSIPLDRFAYSRCYSSEKEKISATSLLVQILRMRQCCGHLYLLKKSFNVELLEHERQQVAVEDLFSTMTLNEDVAGTSFKADEYVDPDKSAHFDISATSSKVESVMNMIHVLNFEKPTDKIVIVSQWTSMLSIVAHHLEQAKLTFAVIDGSVTARKRMTLVDEFNRNPVKPKIMLVSLQAGGVGLNLIGGNHLFLLDMHWNPALEQQAFDRIYRVGQTKEVFVHKFVVEDSVEEQILKLQAEKLEMANSVMEGADVEKKVKLTLTDMKNLFNI